MAIQQSELERIIANAFPEAEFQVIDLAGDNDHYELRIKSSQFANLTKVKQHKLVYDAIGSYIKDNQLHALAIKTEPK